jgi:hypothetical protein
MAMFVAFGCRRHGRSGLATHFLLTDVLGVVLCRVLTDNVGYNTTLHCGCQAAIRKIYTQKDLHTVNSDGPASKK